MIGKQTVFVGVYEDRYGPVVRVFRTPTGVLNWKNSIADENWEKEFPDDSRPDVDIGDAYFELMGHYMGEEWFSTHEVDVEEVDNRTFSIGDYYARQTR